MVIAKANEEAFSAWPDTVPAEVLFDPLSTVSATYGVAFQTRFRVHRESRNVWSSRATIFVIDQDGLLRHVDSHHEEDIREDGIFPILDKLKKTSAAGATKKGQ